MQKFWNICLVKQNLTKVYLAFYNLDSTNFEWSSWDERLKIDSVATANKIVETINYLERKNPEIMMIKVEEDLK